MLPQIEIDRAKRIKENQERLSALGIGDIVASLGCKAANSKRTRAPKVKGVAPSRKSTRTSKVIHNCLSENQLSVQLLPQELRFDVTKRRINFQTMPRAKRLCAPHMADTLLNTSSPMRSVAR